MSGLTGQATSNVFGLTFLDSLTSRRVDIVCSERVSLDFVTKNRFLSNNVAETGSLEFADILYFSNTFVLPNPTF